jgi:crotonobetainyl-CoA:carnitine CoA-transferase CaiB-like acyl-CoA transferase
MTALQGLKILDISRVLAGPNCTQIFADFGAEVWKIEAPWGDEARGWGKAGFAMLNRGKKSIVINFEEPRGQELVRRLAVRADIAVENFKVDNLKRFGIDLPALMALNDRLIGVSITGFGQTGPLRTGLGYDMVLQAMTGLMSVTGDPDRPPARVGTALFDIMTGLNAAVAILVALQERNKSGKGQYIDVSLFDVGMASLMGAGTRYANDGVIANRQGSIHPTHAPVEPIEAADGPILVSIGTDGQFVRLCDAIGRPELATDPRFETNAARMENRAELAGIIETVLKTRSRAAWTQEFLKHRVPAGPINNVGEAIDDPHAKARNVLWTVESGDGPLQVMGNPIQHMSRTPPVAAGAAPRLGAHTAAILQSELDLSDDELATLIRDQVVRVSPPTA